MKSKIIRPVLILSSFSFVSLIFSWLIITQSETNYLFFIAKSLILIIGISIAFAMASSEAAKITENVNKLKDFVHAIKNGTAYRDIPEYFEDIANDMIIVESQFKKTLQYVLDIVSQFDKDGYTDNVDVPINNSFNIIELKRTIDQLSTKTNYIFDSLKDIEVVKKSYFNSKWEETKQKIIAIQDQNLALKKQIKDIQSFAERMGKGDFSTRFRSDTYKDSKALETSINNWASSIDDYLKDLDKALSNEFNEQINKTYNGQLETVKNRYNRAVEINNTNIESLKSKITDLQEKSKEAEANKPVSRVTRSRGDFVIKPVIQPPKFKNMDFTGRGFGKY